MKDVSAIALDFQFLKVLRAQPSNLCEFIANYLSALLITRENLQVASKVCDNVCENLCHLGLEGDLRNIGLCEEDIQVVTGIISKHFAKERGILTFRFTIFVLCVTVNRPYNKSF